MTAGAFALTTSDGDLRRAITQERETSSKTSAAVFEMHVDRGAGAFAGAIGTLRGELRGSFAGEGSGSVTRFPRAALELRHELAGRGVRAVGLEAA